MWIRFFLIPSLVFASVEPMLCEAEAITSKYSQEVAKTPPPSFSPKTISALSKAPVWFSIDLSEIKAPALQVLSEDLLLDFLKEIGVRGFYLQDLKNGKNHRKGLGVDPSWGNFTAFQSSLEKWGISLISDGLGASSGITADFLLALQNVDGFRDLYHLVEIPKEDWAFLPQASNSFVNVSWLCLSQLHKKGYVPEMFSPYVKKSSWNATPPIAGKDQKTRRWIYLKENQHDPVFNWLSSSFAASRVASSDILDSLFCLNQKVICLDQKIGQNALETLSLWTRKLGGFSALKNESSLRAWEKASSDLIFDTLTPSLLLHAAVTEDAEVLRLFYKLLLQENIPPQKLIHCLQPFDKFSCDYTLFLNEPRKTVEYHEEVLTQEALRQRLLRKDVFRLLTPPFTSWPSFCNKQEKINPEKALGLHLLFAFFYALQPGVFSFSVSDLLGLERKETTDILSPTETSLYGSLSSQMKNQCSFAQRLRSILFIRNKVEMGKAKLLAVLKTKHPGLLLLLHETQKNKELQLLAINFSSQEIEQMIDLPCIKRTSAINLMNDLFEEKPLDSPLFHLKLEPLSGKAILFQTKYYD